LEQSDSSYSRNKLIGIYFNNDALSKNLLFRFKDGGKYYYINTNSKEIINLVNVLNGSN